MILVKLGGSVITNKSKPLSAKKATISRIGRALAKLDEPVILVHGGGSFGHYWSVKYGMHTKPKVHSARGVATVKGSMVKLNSIVLDGLLSGGLNAYPLPPTALIRSQKVILEAARQTTKIADYGMVPVTYGDAVWVGTGRTSILSGDRIMSMLAAVMKPRLCIFALNEDGVYDMSTHKTIPELPAGARPKVGDVKMDVTGGMARKLVESARIVRGGTDVFIANGNAPERIVDAVKRRRYNGTLIRGARYGRRTTRTS